MKKTLLSATVVATLAGSALAADLPSRKAPPAFVPPPPPALWTGFYVGLNAGGTFSENNNVLVRDGGGSIPAFLALQSAGAIPTKLSVNDTGFIGGGQIGYNYQFNSFVGGVEADIAGLAGNSNNASASGVFGAFPYATSVNRSIDYIGTVRGRIGYLFTPALLLYGTGGLAYGQTNLNLSLVGPAPFALTSPYSDTRVGWTAGGGVEWMFMPSWSAKAEYLYYDIGTAVAPSGAVALGANFDSLQSAAKFNGHIIRAGVNYHFNWGAAAPVAAKY